jgi:hypothetical protein
MSVFLFVVEVCGTIGFGVTGIRETLRFDILALELCLARVGGTLIFNLSLVGVRGPLFFGVSTVEVFWTRVRGTFVVGLLSVETFLVGVFGTVGFGSTDLDFVLLDVRGALFFDISAVGADLLLLYLIDLACPTTFYDT